MTTKILRNICIDAGVLFVSARLLTAGTSDGSLDSGNMPLCPVHPTYVTLDVPGAFYGTLPVGINPAGAIAGVYADAGAVSHGFVRAPDGTITTFDASGAGTGPGQGTMLGPGHVGGYCGPVINPAGTITGYYVDVNDAFHGFLRARDGSITTFDAPGAGNGFGQGTNPVAITPAGAITGYYVEASYAQHGFLRARDGTFTTFDPPGSVFTVANSISPGGAITGAFSDASNATHGFLRIP
jgi:hypothetical protein